MPVNRMSKQRLGLRISNLRNAGQSMIQIAKLIQRKLLGAHARLRQLIDNFLAEYARQVIAQRLALLAEA